ncbi:glycoside hydrolase family 16 protein [Flavobacterium sp.]|uniref:glycoside hydrolase family 16 protein n=1 Tax=Flavobacterium sp. TaxID=239 RepID=UPI00261FEF6F|nr:glycoside hydrolase family 16 protein [Flavobacterium sp.]MDG2432712.1 glycoside hydrolase family 16 protein [Flavobacterium sp.]
MKKQIVILLFSTLAIAQPKGKKLVWEEQFSGKELNAKDWNLEVGDGCPNCGWGNNERQLYSKENHHLVDGNFVIVASNKEGKYAATRMNTKGKKEFTYGYIEARAKIPRGQGIWPAFWMLGANIDQVGWPKCGEIDILEYVGKEPSTIFTSLHTQDSHGNTINTKKTKFEGIEQGFHLYAIDWTKDKIDFFVDHKLVYSFNPTVKNENTWPYDKPFFILINVAIGGNFGGPEVDDTIFPQEFLIDYVKVYQ